MIMCITIYQLSITMQYIGAHVEPYKPVDLTTSSNPKKRKAPAPKKGADGEKKKRTGTQAPYRLSEDLQAVVGKSILPRPQVTQALWAYIRENNLQVSVFSFGVYGL